MPEHQKCFILPMHRLRCWKETVVFCAGTCLCNIFCEFIFIFCFPHCCHFPSASLYFTQRLGRGVPLFRLMKIVHFECSWMFEWNCTSATWCVLFCLFLFFFYFYFFNFFVWIVYFWTTQIGARFEVALMEILQCTQLPSETTAALRHGWSVKTQYSSRNQTPRSPSLIHCMCSNISISRSVQQTLHENFQTSARLCDCWLISWEPRTRRTGVRHAE